MNRTQIEPEVPKRSPDLKTWGATVCRQQEYIMTPSELKTRVEARGSKFFSRGNMRAFGDTMRNYRVVGPIEVQTWSGERVVVWELQRKRPVQANLSASAYFDADTFEQRWPKV